jgi:hypothetical protein
MKTLFSIVLIAVLAPAVLLVLNPSKANAWDRGPVVGFSVVVPPFGVSIGAAAPYYPGPVYVAPRYPVYRRAYYLPYYRLYYGYGPHSRDRHWSNRGWKGDWHGRDYGRGHGHWRY